MLTPDSVFLLKQLHTIIANPLLYHRIVDFMQSHKTYVTKSYIVHKGYLSSHVQRISPS